MKPRSSCKVKPFFPCQVLQPDYVKCVVRNQTFGWWTCWVIDAEERTKHGTPALSPNHQGLNGETGKDLCTGSGLSWIAVVASNRFPPCILPSIIHIHPFSSVIICSAPAICMTLWPFSLPLLPPTVAVITLDEDCLLVSTSISSYILDGKECIVSCVYFQPLY